jgi:hypothetical protein
VRAEFGAPAGTPLHNFYRGGPWVPNIPQNANVPAAPPVRLAQLAGAVVYAPPVISGPFDITMPAHQSSATGTWTVSGGTGSYSVNWVKLSNTGEAININATNTLSPTWSRVHNNTEGDSSWRLDVNDGVQTVSRTVDVFGASSN